jgi:hypothetical protein
LRLGWITFRMALHAGQHSKSQTQHTP